MDLAVDQRLECSIPVVARAIDGRRWMASMELPRELAALSIAEQVSTFDSVAEALAEQRRANAGTDETVVGVTQPWLVVGLAVLMRRTQGRGWRASVNLSWPDAWVQVSRSERDALLAAIEDTIQDARQTVQGLRQFGE